MNAAIRLLVLLCLALAVLPAHAGDIFDPKVFNWQQYKSLNPDLPSGWDEATTRWHWYTWGSHEARRGNNTFHVKAYCEKNTDLLYMGYCRNYHAALVHYVDHGQAEGRKQEPTERIGPPKVGLLYSTWNAVAHALYRNLAAPETLSVERLIRQGSLRDFRQALIDKNGTQYPHRCQPVATTPDDPQGMASALLCGFGNFMLQAYSDDDSGNQTLACIYQATAAPALGPPYQDFNGDSNGVMSDATDQALEASMSCPQPPSIDAVLDRHADQISAMGVDFIIIDASNGRHAHKLTWLWEFGPTIRLLDRWKARIETEGKAATTPRVAFFFPAKDPESHAMWRHWESILTSTQYDSVLLKDKECTEQAGGTYACSDKRVAFIVSDAAPPQWSSLSNAYIKARMWAQHAFIPSPDIYNDTTNENAYWRGVSGFMTPCVAQARVVGQASITSYSTSIVSLTSGLGYESTHCNQPWSVNGPLGSVASVAPSFQLGLASLPFEAAGRLRGLTLKRQFQSVINSDHKPRYVIVSAWNETIAQLQLVGGKPWRQRAEHRQWSMGFEQDECQQNSTSDCKKVRVSGYCAQANAVVPSGYVDRSISFVDTYGREYARSLEDIRDAGPQHTNPPTVFTSSLRSLASSCIQALKIGRCDAGPNQGNRCCQESAAEDQYRNLFSYRTAASPQVRPVLNDERAAMEASGWTEVPTTIPHEGYAFQTDFLNMRLTTPVDDIVDHSGPFIVFAAAKADERVALKRCWNGYPQWNRTYLGSDCPWGEAMHLGYVSKTRSSETPRALRSCYQANLSGPPPAEVGFHKFAVGLGCPTGWEDHGVLGYVK